MDDREERLRVLGAQIRTRVSGRLGDIWWAFMLRGLFAGLLGICALFWPTSSFAILTRLVGLYCLADAISGLIGTLQSDRSTYLLQAVVGFMVGAVLLFWPARSVRTLMMVFGAWALLTGVSHLQAARKANIEDTDRSLMTTMGGTLAALGLMLLIWPGSGVVAISWAIALAALLFAAVSIFLALHLRRLKVRMDERGLQRSAR